MIPMTASATIAPAHTMIRIKLREGPVALCIATVNLLDSILEISYETSVK
jgi:hypothetical protein